MMKPSALFTALLFTATPLAAGVPELCGECRMEKFATCGGFLEGAAVAPDNSLWAVDLLSGKVLQIADNGQCTARGNTGGQPNGAKFGPDGQLWIADKQLGLLRMDPKTGAITTVAQYFRNERLRGLNDMVFDAKGGVYFTEPYGSGAIKTTGRVFYLPPGKDARLEIVSEGLAFPNGIVLANGGANIYVGEYGLKRITRLRAVDSRDDFDITTVVAYTQGGDGPDGMLMRPDGILLAANFRAGEVLAFDPIGKPMGTISVPGGTMTTNVAIRDGWLYVTEGSRGEIWRVKLLK